MSRAYGEVGPKSLGDGAEKQIRQTAAGNVMTQHASGRFYELAVRGNLFMYSTAVAGIVMAAPANTNEFCIWNPIGNGVAFVPLKVMWATVSGAAAIAGSLEFYKQINMGGAIGTGAPFSVFTNIAPVPCYLGGVNAGLGSASACRFSTTNTTTAALAAVYLGATGWSSVQGRPADAVAPIILSQVLHGIVIYPGSTFRICSAKAQAWTAVITVIGAEVQLPLTV
jgi:hypothetical protein